MRIPSPDDIWQGLVNRLPKSIGGWVWNVTYILAWITLPYSIASAISDLRIVIEVIGWLYSHLDFLAGIIDWMRPIVVGALDVWRTLTAPIRQFLGALLPFAVEQIYIDLGTIVLVSLPSLVRYSFQHNVRMRAERVRTVASDLAQKKKVAMDAEIKRREKELHEAKKSKNENSGIFGWIGGILAGGIALIVAPPLAPAAFGLGAGLGASAGENSTSAPDRSQEISRASEDLKQAEMELATAQVRSALEMKRLRQARSLVWVSAILSLLALLVADAYFRTETSASELRRPAGDERAMCVTRFDPGRACACTRDPTNQGVSRQSRDGSVNYCWVRPRE